MHVPNPVKMFTWKACHNILPTKDSLRKRYIILDPSILFCLSAKEIVRHVGFGCLGGVREKNTEKLGRRNYLCRGIRVHV
jgi:hypothetical protein